MMPPGHKSGPPGDEALAASLNSTLQRNQNQLQSQHPELRKNVAKIPKIIIEKFPSEHRTNI